MLLQTAPEREPARRALGGMMQKMAGHVVLLVVAIRNRNPRNRRPHKNIITPPPSLTTTYNKLIISTSQDNYHSYYESLCPPNHLSPSSLCSRVRPSATLGESREIRAYLNANGPHPLWITGFKISSCELGCSRVEIAVTTG